MPTSPTPTELPRRLRQCFAAAAAAPTTELKNLLALLLVLAVVLFLMAALWVARVLDHDVLYALLTFVGAFCGLGVIQYGVKRATYTPSPPNTPDVETATATGTTPRAGGSDGE